MKTADLENKAEKKGHESLESRSFAHSSAFFQAPFQRKSEKSPGKSQEDTRASLAPPAFRLTSSEETLATEQTPSVETPYQLPEKNVAQTKPTQSDVEPYQLKSSAPVEPAVTQQTANQSGPSVIQRWGLPDWVSDGMDAASDMAESGMNAVSNAVSSGAEAVTETVSSAAEIARDVVRSGAQQVRRGVSAATDMVRSGAETVAETVSSGAEAVVDGARAVGNRVRRGANRVYEGAREVAGTVRDGVQSGVERVGRTARRGAEAVVEGATNVVSRLRSGAQSLVNRGSEVVQAGIERMRSVGSTVQEAVSTGMSAMREFGSRAIDRAREIGEQTRAAVSEFVNRATNRLRDGFNHVFSAATASDLLLNSVLGTARILDSIFGPDGTAVQAEDIPDEHAFDEFVARELAYRGDGNDMQPATPDDVKRLTSEGFEGQIHNVPGLEGFQMTYIIPQENSDRNPMLAIRGSENDSDFYKDWGSDMDYHQVGDRQFNANREQIARLIEYLCQNSPSGQIDLTGHSLGGGLAQTIMAHHTRQIARLTTFAAPGQSQQSIDMYNQNVESMRDEGLEGPEVAHHVENQGMVYLVGDGHIPGTTYRHDVGHIDFVTAHTTNLVDGVEDHSIERFDEFPDQLRGRLAEAIRRGVGSTVIRPILGELDQLQDMRNDHYNRNQHNQAPATEPVNDPNWRRLPDSQSVYHQNGEEGRNNRKYVSTDGGHHEAVYNEQGELVTDDENMGTYNHHGPDDAWGHFQRDVVPYWVWGNTEEDETPLINRIFGPRIRERIAEGGRGVVDSLRRSITEMYQEGMRRVRGEGGQGQQE